MALSEKDQADLAFLRQYGGEMPATQTPEATLQGQMADVDNAYKFPMDRKIVEGAKDFFREYAPMTSEALGSIYGAYRAGATVPGPIPAKVAGGMVLGAMGGRFFGESVVDAVEGEVDILDTLQKTLESGAWAAAGEGAGALISKGMQAIKNYRAGSKLSEEELANLAELQQALQATKVTDESGRLVTLTPAQVANSPFQTNLEKIAISGFGGDAVGKMYQVQSEALQKVFDRTVRKFGVPNREQSGKAFIDTINQVEDELIKFAEPKYAALDKLARNQTIDISPLLGKARWKLIDNSRNLRKGPADLTTNELLNSATRLPPAEKKLYDRILGNKTKVTFSDMFKDLTTLTKELRTLKAEVNSPNRDLIQEYTKVIKQYHTVMEKQAAKMGTDVYDQYKTISTIYREGMTNLRSDAVTSLVTRAPEFVGETVFSEGNVTLVKQAYKAIDDAASIAKQIDGTAVDAEALKNNFKSGYLDSLFKEVQRDMSNNAADRASAVFGKVKSDPKIKDTFNTVLNKSEQAEVMKVLKWAEALERQTAGNFSLVVRGKQSQGFNRAVQNAQSLGAGGAAAGALGIVSPFGAIAIGVGIMSSPALLAKWAVSGKATNKMLTKASGLISRAAQGKIDAQKDFVTMMTLLSTMPLRQEDIPPEWRKEGLSANEAAELMFYNANANSEESLPPMPEEKPMPQAVAMPPQQPQMPPLPSQGGMLSQ